MDATTGQEQCLQVLRESAKLTSTAKSYASHGFLLSIYTSNQR